MDRSLLKPFVGVAFLTASLLIACEQAGFPVDDIRIVAEGDRPECPHDWNEYFGGRTPHAPERGRGAKVVTIEARSGRIFPAQVAASATTYLISREMTNIPELHDCQRLVKMVGGAREYDALTAVFANDRTDSSVAEPGPFVAVEVFAEGPYPSLGIREGFHCLVIDADSSRAIMVFMGKSHTATCRSLDLTVLPAGANAYNLELQHDPPASAVPPVARFQWDATSNQQLIGFKCRPTQWCTAGPDSFVTSTADASAPAVMQVPGWSDDQYIADYSSSGITPSGAFARVIPVENLGAFTALAEFSDWTLVAHVQTPAGIPADYATKLGFTATPVATRGLSGLNQVFFCYGSSTKCAVPPGDLGQKAGGCTVASTTGDQMWAKVVPATGTKPLYHCVAYRKHPTITMPGGELFDIPGVVRLRWRADDETLWVRCPYGCCEVHAGV